MRAVRLVAVAAVVSLVALSGCSDGLGPRGVEPSSDASRLAAEAAPSPSYAVRKVGVVSVPAVVARKYGAAQAREAYRTAVAVTTDYTFRRSLLESKPSYTVADFAGPETVMTGRAASEWSGYVAKAVAGDAVAQSAVSALSYFRIERDGFDLVVVDPLVVNEAVSGAVLSVDALKAGSPALRVDLTYRAEIRYVAGQRWRLPVTKAVSYWMVPTASGWKVDAFLVNYQSGAAVSDVAGE